MKKTLISWMLTVALVSPTFANNNSLDLDSLDSLISEPNKTTNSATTNTANVWTVSNVEVVVQWGTQIPVNKKTDIMVKVTSSTSVAMNDTNVKLDIIPTDKTKNNFKVENITYNSEEGYFVVPFTPTDDKEDISFTVKVTSLNNEKDFLEKLQTIKPLKAEANTAKVETTANTNEPKTEDKKEETVIETKDEIKTEDIIPVKEKEEAKDKKLEANILSTKIIGTNRLVINFDRELFLPEEPLSLIKLTKKDNTEVKLSNVTLWDDKKSMVVLTSEDLGKEEYKLSINEVVDGETKKRINVVNSTLTVTWLNEVLVVLFALLLTSGVLFYRRKNS